MSHFKLLLMGLFSIYGKREKKIKVYRILKEDQIFFSMQVNLIKLSAFELGDFL